MLTHYLWVHCVLSKISNGVVRYFYKTHKSDFFGLKKFFIDVYRCISSYLFSAENTLVVLIYVDIFPENFLLT